tara:strand:- start:2265 stop:4154 length:1890 start_codon:yes stop_codon:yes gene_type:complete
MNKLFTIGLLLAACGGSQNYDDVYTGDSHGKISGVVTSTEGQPLVGVTVTAQDISAVTLEDGTYTLLDVNPSENIVVKFSKQGFAKNYTTTAIQSWETVSSNASLLEADGYAVIDSQQVNTISVEGTRISFSENSFVNSDGSVYTGEVNVQITHVDPSTSDVFGAPTDLTAIAKQSGDSSAKDATSVSQLVSYGMVDVTLFGSDGQELKLSSDAPASLEIPITNGDLPELYQLAAGDTQSAWSFNPEQGMWIEEGVGNVIEEDGNTFFQFEASHFSWWNCDQGFVPSCASGRVVDVTGFPVRGAEVTCSGTQSTSTAVTDDNGYYVCSVLVGDTVTFTGTTFVDNRNWFKNTSKFMDGEGTSSATCEPIDTIQIDVCRLAGVVNVQNINGSTDIDDSVNSDNVGAFFWEPPGDVQYCDDLWQSLDVGDCWVGTHDEVQRSFPEGSIPGIPDDSRSVGSWFEVRTEGEYYRIQRENVSGQPNYTWDSHTVDGIEVTDDRPEFNDGDILDVQAPGDYSSYFGAWEVAGFTTIPSAVEFNTNDSMLTLDNTLSVSYKNFTDGEVFVTAFVGETQMICKFEDTGRFNLSSTGLDAGFGGLSIQHIETNLFAGPDGLPIKTQVFSGESMTLSVK